MPKVFVSYRRSDSQDVAGRIVDPITTEDIRRNIRQLADSGIGILVTDHNVREVFRTADRVYLITEGQVATQVTPHERRWILCNMKLGKHAMNEHVKTQVRIVAGSLRGRKLTAVVHEGMRPTPQLVREAFFSILGNAVPDRVFYDVFAGTGVVGLEAVSRGARSARLIEKDPRQVADILKYATQFGVTDRVQVLRADAYRWAERWIPGPEPVTIFISPPFADLTTRSDDFLALIRTLIDKAPKTSVITIQAEVGFPVESLPNLPAWDVRAYGRNLLLVLVTGDADQQNQ